MSCVHSYRNPVDWIGHASLDPDGEHLLLIEPLSPEVVETILTSAHRIIVSVQFVADDERMAEHRTVTP